MKLCWDNVNEMTVTKGGNFRVGKQVVEYKEACEWCGQPFLGALGTNARFCTYSCRNSVNKNRYINGRYIDKDGYIQIRVGNKYRREHPIVAEKVLGRSLRTGEVVHHINMNKLDNRKKNLLICTQSYHAFLHKQMAQAWVKMAGL